MITTASVAHETDAVGVADRHRSASPALADRSQVPLLPLAPNTKTIKTMTTKKKEESRWSSLYVGEPGKQPQGTRNFSAVVTFTDFSKLIINCIYVKDRAAALMTALARVADGFNEITEISILDITAHKEREAV